MVETWLNISLSISIVRNLEVAPDLGNSGRGLSRLPWNVSRGCCWCRRVAWGCRIPFWGRSSMARKSVQALGRRSQVLFTGLSTSFLRHLSSPESSPGEWGWSCSARHDPALRATLQLLCYTPLVTQASPVQGRGDQGCGYQEGRVIGTSWCLPYKCDPYFEELALRFNNNRGLDFSWILKRNRRELLLNDKDG